MRGRLFLAVVLGAALSGCLSEPGPTATAVASAVAESATDLLACDSATSPMGGFADNFGPDGSGATADEAFASWLELAPFGVPRSGYERLGSVGNRTVYTYSNGDRVKVVVVISPRFSELAGGAPFTIEELRTCDPAEYGAAVDLGPHRRVWANEETGEILDDIAGPAHCGWESARMLHTSAADGALAKQYIRDPRGVFAGVAGFRESYAEGVELPEEAAFSGYRTADGLELWFTPDDRAAYVVTPDGVERWPRVDPPTGCR